MQKLRLYTLVVPWQAQLRNDSDARRETAAQNALQSDVAPLQSLGSQPGEHRVRATLRGQYAELMAAEVAEISDPAGYDVIPVFADDPAESEATPDNGYYTVRTGSRQPVDPKAEYLQTVDLRLEKQGTRWSHFREVSVNATDVDNAWGNDEVCEVGVPAAAARVRWYNTVTGDSTAASPSTTRTSEFADVSILDVTPGTTPYDRERLAVIYDLPYPEEGRVDARVWDTYGRSSKVDADGVCSWGRVFSTAHETAGSLVLDNGLVRVTLDTTGGLTAEEYDASSSAWTSLSLPASDWSLREVDLVETNPARVATHLEFVNSSTSESYALRAILHRGRTRLQFDRPESATTAVPSGLKDFLAPLAGSSLYDSGASLGLRERGEVNA